jgi:hypothetical protein
MEFTHAELSTIQFFEVYSQEVRMKEKLNSDRTNQRCVLNSRRATYCMYIRVQ